MDKYDSRSKIIEKIIVDLYMIKRKIDTKINLSLSEIQITHPQIYVLCLIKKNGTMSIKDLAKRLETTSSAATQITNSLFKKGLLLKKRNPDNRRVSKIELLNKSKKQFYSIKGKSINALSTLFDSLDNEELQKYNDLSTKIAKRILLKKWDRKK